MSSITVGAHCVAYVNSEKFGWVTDLSYDQATQVEEETAVDFNEPYELIPGQSSTHVQLKLLHPSFSQGLEGVGIAAHPKQQSDFKYFSFAIVDRLTDQVIFRADHCMITHQNWSVGARGIMTGTVAFSCRSSVNQYTQAQGS